MIVTVEARHGSDVPDVTQKDVMVYEGHNRDQVTDWVPARAEHAQLELFVLIDDSSGGSIGNQLDELRKFMEELPSSALVGVAYMQNGTAKVEQNLTNDHALAAKGLRLPLGMAGANASPYFSLSDLLKRWPQTKSRREVLMVTDGIDRYYGSGDLNDPYLSSAIDAAQREGVLVSAIYNPSAGHFGHSYWQAYWGQMYLAEIADRTGGEAYYIGMTGSPVSFSLYLRDLTNRTNHQYLLTFVAKGGRRRGDCDLSRCGRKFPMRNWWRRTGFLFRRRNRGNDASFRNPRSRFLVVQKRSSEEKNSPPRSIGAGEFLMLYFVGVTVSSNGMTSGTCCRSREGKRTTPWGIWRTFRSRHSGIHQEYCGPNWSLPWGPLCTLIQKPIVPSIRLWVSALQPESEPKEKPLPAEGGVSL